MIVRNLFVSFLALSSITFLDACGGSGNSNDPSESPSMPRGLTPNTIDLTVDKILLDASIKIEDLYFSPDSCSVKEGTVGGAGIRRVVSFTTAIVNLGDQDMNVGTSTNPAPPLTTANFQFDECHGHDHFLNFVEYSIKGDRGEAEGKKLGFYLANVQQYFVNESSLSQYPNLVFGSGISSGWADVYSNYTPGQWVDVTNLPAGEYKLNVKVNPDKIITEANDYYPNSVSVTVELPSPNDPLPVTIYEAQIDPIFNGFNGLN